jgi:hypothetical protein
VILGGARVYARGILPVLLLGATAFFGCRGTPLADQVTGAWSCDASPLVAGEVRVRRIPCDDELISGGDGHTNEWLLENALVRYVIRAGSSSLTLLDVGGGTLVDGATWGGSDRVEEVVPLWDGAFWLQDPEVDWHQGETEASVVVTGVAAPIGFLEERVAPDTALEPTGQTREVEWRLEADSPVLEAQGADGFYVMPFADLVLSASILHEVSGSHAVLGVDGLSEDLGGAVRFQGPARLAVGSASDVMAALWPGGPTVWGETDGDGVETLADGEVTGWLPVASNRFEGTVPAGTDGLRAVARGFDPGPVVKPGSDLDLPLGEDGRLYVRVADGDGQDRAAILRASSMDGATELLAVPPGGAMLPVGVGTWDLLLTAGPKARRMELFDVAIPPREGSLVAGGLEAELADTYDPGGWILADLDVEGWPSWNDRVGSSEAVSMTSADGVAFAVQSAVDEVGQTELEAPWDASTLVRAGSMAWSDEAGHVISWPWTPSNKKAAHGAVAWRGLEARDLAAVARGGASKDRFLAVDLDWTVAAGPAWSWDPVPDLLRLAGIEDLSAYLALLDAFAPVAPAGPFTWVPVDDPGHFAPVEVEAKLVEAKTVASSGPFIDLTANGYAPGSLLHPSFSGPVHLTVYAPPWMPLEHVEIVVDGAVARAWDLEPAGRAQRFEWRGIVPAAHYILAAAWSDTDPGAPCRGKPWAITSPVWTGGP